MNPGYQQQTGKPLFPNIIWSRPETKQGAGKLLIIGGQAHEFLHVAESYAAAEKAGAGTIRVVMPDSTQKITRMLPNIEYAPSNNSGSFARIALAELLDAALWSDGVLLGGDIGRNSETSLMLESFISKYDGLLVISANALSSITMPLSELIERPRTVLSITITDLQKLGIAIGLERPVTSTIGNVELAQILKELSSVYPAAFAVIKDASIWTCLNGEVALTKNSESKSAVEFAAQSAVWSIQNPAKLYEAFTTAAYC